MSLNLERVLSPTPQLSDRPYRLRFVATDPIVSDLPSWMPPIKCPQSRGRFYALPVRLDPLSTFHLWLYEFWIQLSCDMRGLLSDLDT